MIRLFQSISQLININNKNFTLYIYVTSCTLQINRIDKFFHAIAVCFIFSFQQLLYLLHSQSTSSKFFASSYSAFNLFLSLPLSFLLFTRFFFQKRVSSYVSCTKLFSRKQFSRSDNVVRRLLLFVCCAACNKRSFAEG